MIKTTGKQGTVFISHGSVETDLTSMKIAACHL